MTLGSAQHFTVLFPDGNNVFDINSDLEALNDNVDMQHVKS